MTPAHERRALQAAMAVATFVPIFGGGTGVIEGAAWLGAGGTDLDSHIRYLSGLLLAIGLAFAISIPQIERHSARIRLLGALVVVGGLARLWSLIVDGAPSGGHLFGLAMELVVVPALVLWQARVARRFAGAMPDRRET